MYVSVMYLVFAWENKICMSESSMHALIYMILHIWFYFLCKYHLFDTQ